MNQRAIARKISMHLTPRIILARRMMPSKTKRKRLTIRRRRKGPIRRQMEKRARMKRILRLLV